MLLAQAETVGAGWRHAEEFLDRIRRLSREDILRVARRYLVEDARTVGILVPTPPPKPMPSGPSKTP
jgi:zinc protease